MSLLRIIHSFCARLGHFSMGLSVILGLLTLQQVIARYWFQASSIALQELQWHLFGAIFCLSMAWTLQKDQHVRVDVFYHNWSARKKMWIDSLGHILFLWPICIVLIVYGIEDVHLSRSYPNHPPLSTWSQDLQLSNTSLIQSLDSLEHWLRQWLLIGEGSSNPGGLAARWIPKALIPISGILLILQSIANIGSQWGSPSKPQKPELT